MIPVIDCEDRVVENAKKFLAAVEDVGFVYLKNIGIPSSAVDKMFDVTDKFWGLPLKTKLKCSVDPNYPITGYVPTGLELLDYKNSVELRESYNHAPGISNNIFPDEDLPEFRPTVSNFAELCHAATKKILEALAIALNLQNPEFFNESHDCIGKAGNTSVLRFLHYPPLPDIIPPGNTRCGEHSDYGTVTLLFQDDIGGLEVQNRDGTFVPATPEPGAVLINTADLLQRWTSNRIIAVRHRVRIPKDRKLYTSKRRSIAYFVNPNDDFIVEPLDGSDCYPRITYAEYLKGKVLETTGYEYSSGS